MFGKLLLLLLTLSSPIHLKRSPVPRMSVLDEERRDGYVCRLVEYNVSRNERVQAYLIVPDGASAENPRPGLVLLHDHGARFDIGKEKLVRPLPAAAENIRLSSAQWIEDNFDGVYFADRLAAEGYVVIVPDMLYWGSRSTPDCQRWSRMKFCGEPGNVDSLKTVVYEGQRAVYDSLARKGVVWAEQTLEEDAAAARLLKGLEYVDAEAIGTFGWSMGAHRAWLLTAFCKDVRTGVALCWMTLKETVDLPYKASDYSMLIPAFRERYDFPDIARFLAPKPFMFLAGRQDRLFPLWAVERSYSIMESIYEEKGASGNLRTEYFEGPHHCGTDVQKRIMDYLVGQLPLPSDIQEQ